MGEILKNKKGITLIALVVTIIILLILAGVSIATLTGDNGILTQAGSAKEKTEIANEKEIIDIATIWAMERNRYGDITEHNLEKALKGKFGSEEAEVTDMLDGTFTVKCPSGRVYEVDYDGNVRYLGKEKELLEKVVITADKESDATPQLIQTVKITAKTYVAVEDKDITLAYAWSKSKDESPADDEFFDAELTGTTVNRTATIYSSATTQGDYYLWVRVVIKGKETEKIFGEYAIKENTTLVSCQYETKSTSTFLGMPIQRNLIKSVKIQTDLEGHRKDDGTCHDVSNNRSGAILAWYTEEVVDGIKLYNVTIAERGGVVANTDSQNLFRYIGYGLLEEVTITGLENLDTSNVTNMWYMFGNCNSLTNLDVSSLNTKNVLNFGATFSGCNNLKTLDVSNFDTRNATSMTYMFANCNSLTNLDVSNFDISRVTTTDNMFKNCKMLTRLDVSNFNTSSATNMKGMFQDCSKLTNLNLNNFDTSKVTNMNGIFKNCSSLTSINVSHFDTSSAIDIVNMFSGCSSLTSINVSKFNTSNVTNMAGMFQGCSKLTSLNLNNFDTSSVKNMSYMFYNCSGLTSLNINNFNTSSVTSMENMFDGCSALTTLDLSNFNTSNTSNMGRMFQKCKSLTTLNVSGFNTNNVTSMVSMFSGCNSLTLLDVSNFNTSNVINMNGMFRGCSSLTSLDASNFNVTNVTAHGDMFYGILSSIVIKTNSSTAEWLKTNFTWITDDNIELVS